MSTRRPNNKCKNKITPKTYTVVLRCKESTLHIPTGCGALISPLVSPFGDYVLKILTRTDNVKGVDTPIPREMWIEASGPAPSLQVAVSTAVSRANDYVRQVASGTNAWQGILVDHPGYDSTAGERERDFFQNWNADETGLPRVARTVDTEVLIHLLRAITKRSEKDKNMARLAISHYTDALQHWKIGNEVYTISHLYIGIEAITPSVIRWEVANRGLKNRKELEGAVCLSPEGSVLHRLASYLYQRSGGYKPSLLDAWIRREVIFRGDHETYRAAKASLSEHAARRIDKSELAPAPQPKRDYRTCKDSLAGVWDEESVPLLEGDLATLKIY